MDGSISFLESGVFSDALFYWLVFSMRFPRASGVLLHPTSLPNEFGIGDFGKSAYDFVDFLDASKQSYWQILPLGPTGFGDSPYQSFSAFAGNTNLISPEVLVEDKLLSAYDLLEKPDFPTDKVDFGEIIKWKDQLLKKAYANFRLTANSSIRSSFQSFIQEVSDWLDDYALFRTIKESQSQKSWLEWEMSLRKRDEDALREIRLESFETIQEQKFYQFLFFKQWMRLKNYANGKGIKIIGDIPIFVSLDSADVWCNPREFKLNEDLSPKVVAGVPPDFFSKTGQLWGNPIYDWEKMRVDNFSWWVSRIKFALKTVDILRIDHFRGFEASWEVPGKDKTAENGIWVKVPGRELFHTLKQRLGDLRLVAEDLGDVSPEVEVLRDENQFPGMRVLQFGFGGDAENTYLPHNYVKNCVAYTGTHDNDTAVGWFRSKKKAKSKNNTEAKHCLEYLNSNGNEFHWDFIRGVWSSIANTAIAPMQDILGLDNAARMNFPSTKSGNWVWRCDADAFSNEISDRLKRMTEIYGRKRT